MEHLEFIVWMCVFPLFVAIASRVIINARNRVGYQQISAGIQWLLTALVLITWYGIGYLIW